MQLISEDVLKTQSDQETFEVLQKRYLGRYRATEANKHYISLGESEEDFPDSVVGASDYFKLVDVIQFGA